MMFIRKVHKGDCGQTAHQLYILISSIRFSLIPLSFLVELKQASDGLPITITGLIQFQSILADAPADMIVFGMGERQVVDIANLLSRGKNIKEITDIAGTAIKMEISKWRSIGHEGYMEIPGFPDVSRDKE